MLLKLNAIGYEMKLVYDLAVDLEHDQERVKQTQALTLDESKPFFGLKGKHGLFGSSEWWENIRNGRINTAQVLSVIQGSHFAGQDSRWGDEINSVTLKLDDGSITSEGIYANAKRDRKLYVAGARVAMLYVLEELKMPRNGSSYLPIMLEAAVSLKPIHVDYK